MKIKAVNFREIYRMDGVRLIYYPWEKSRIMAFFMAIKKAFYILVRAFRILLKTGPELD